jgi:hypothetical protein
VGVDALLELPAYRDDALLHQQPDAVVGKQAVGHVETRHVAALNP